MGAAVCKFAIDRFDSEFEESGNRKVVPMFVEARERLLEKVPEEKKQREKNMQAEAQ